MKEHVEDPHKLPILIFPEGTCINNTSVMQFKKGSFEVGDILYLCLSLSISLSISLYLLSSLISLIFRSLHICFIYLSRHLSHLLFVKNLMPYFHFPLSFSVLTSGYAFDRKGSSKLKSCAGKNFMKKKHTI